MAEDTIPYSREALHALVAAQRAVFPADHPFHIVVTDEFVDVLGQIIEATATSAAAQEREANAQIADAHSEEWRREIGDVTAYTRGHFDAADEIADAIRARGGAGGAE